MSKLYVAMRLHNGHTNYGRILLPGGCEGVLFTFKTKKAARKYWGNNVELIEIAERKKK